MGDGTSWIALLLDSLQVALDYLFAPAPRRDSLPAPAVPSVPPPG